MSLAQEMSQFDDSKPLLELSKPQQRHECDIHTDHEDPTTSVQVITETGSTTSTSTESITDASNFNQDGNPLSANNYLKPLKGFLKVKSKFRNQKCCLWSSKAALMILTWNLIVSVGFLSRVDPSWYAIAHSIIISLHVYYASVIKGLTYGFIAFLAIFYPLAGLLADRKWGRHKTVLNSLSLIFWCSILIILLGVFMTIGFIPYMVHTPGPLNTFQTVATTVLCIALGLPMFFGVMFILFSLLAFNANILHFGIDQFHDRAKPNAVVMYIHWYVWTLYFGELVARLSLVFDNFLLADLLFFLPILLAVIFLGITLCILKCKPNLFLIETLLRNHHSTSESEEELGALHDEQTQQLERPFITSKVGDVKIFLGILSVLLTVGPIFSADVAFNDFLPGLVYDLELIDNVTYLENGLYTINRFFHSSCFTPLIIVVFIPLYLCFLRPFICNYIPGPFKRIGLGMIVLCVSGICTLVMGLFGPKYCNNKSIDISQSEGCINSITSYFTLSSHFALIPQGLNAFGYMFLYIALFEFICSQSPSSMKGYLMGIFFAIRSIFSSLGVHVIYIPMITYCHSQEQKFPYCGFTYYLVNIITALTGIMLFTFVVRKYKYRQRN